MDKNKLNLNGIIVVNKPKGITSNKVLQQIKHLYNAQKVGHTGTLDPIATGVLPICFGSATKIAHYLLDADKEYIAVIKLGIKTDTDDSYGRIIAKNDVSNISRSFIKKVLLDFHGNILQVPPLYSAIKYNGSPLYKLARDGKFINIKSRNVNIYKLDLLFFNKDILKIKVKCSKGTYIRSLAVDIGKKLESYAHVIDLKRTKSGILKLEKSITLQKLKKISFKKRISIINNIESIFIDKPIYSIMENEKNNFYNKGILTTKSNIDKIIRIYYNNKFIAIGEFNKGRLINKKFVNFNNIY